MVYNKSKGIRQYYFREWVFSEFGKFPRKTSAMGWLYKPSYRTAPRNLVKATPLQTFQWQISGKLFSGVPVIRY